MSRVLMDCAGGCAADFAASADAAGASPRAGSRTHLGSRACLGLRARRTAGWLLAAWMAGLASAHAGTPRTVTIATATGGDADVTRTVLIGPAGQIYRPQDTPGTWRRPAGGGISVAVTGAVEIPGHALFACGARAPLFRADQDTWHVHGLGNRGSCAVAPDGAPAMAIGPHIYTWRNGRWLRLRSAPSTVTALWATTASQVYVATDQGQLLRTRVPRARAAAWSTIRHSLTQDDPIEHVIGHAGKHPYALSRSGAVLRLGATVATLVARDPELTAFQPQAMAAAPDGALWIAGILPASDSSPARAVLARADGARMRMIEELSPLQPEERISVLRVDARGGMLWATGSGTLRYRAQSGSWQEGTILGELPRPLSSVPGRRPAHTR